MTPANEAVVLLSGGQDSTTTLYLALQSHDRVYPVSVRYGQRHAIEIDSAASIVRLARSQGYDVEELQVLDAPALSAACESGLTDDTATIEADGRGGLPTSFVPGRNLLFLTLAAAVAYGRKAHDVWTGVCETDFSGYPDCRRSTIDAMERALSLGVGQAGTTEPWAIRVWTPLMWIDKAATVRMARRLPGCWEAMALTHTCYYGQQPPCGDCPACEIRARGFAQAGEADPLTDP